MFIVIWRTLKRIFISKVDEYHLNGRLILILQYGALIQKLPKETELMELDKKNNSREELKKLIERYGLTVDD